MAYPKDEAAQTGNSSESIKPQSPGDHLALLNQQIADAHQSINDLFDGEMDDEKKAEIDRLAIFIRERQAEAIAPMIQESQRMLGEIYANIDFSAIARYESTYFAGMSQEEKLNFFGKIKSLIDLEVMRLALLDLNNTTGNYENISSIYTTLARGKENIPVEFRHRNHRDHSRPIEDISSPQKTDALTTVQLRRELEEYLGFIYNNLSLIDRYKLDPRDHGIFDYMHPLLLNINLMLSRVRPVQVNGETYDIDQRILDVIERYISKNKILFSGIEPNQKMGRVTPSIEYENPRITQRLPRLKAREIQQRLKYLPQVFLQGINKIRLFENRSEELQALYPEDFSKIMGLYSAGTHEIGLFPFSQAITREENGKLVFDEGEIYHALFHEIGHHLHSQILPIHMLQEWEDVLRDEPDAAITGYVVYNRMKKSADSAAYEDFAESFAFYITNPLLLKIVAPRRYTFMENLMKQYMSEKQFKQHQRQMERRFSQEYRRFKGNPQDIDNFLRQHHGQVIEAYRRKLIDEANS